MGVEVAVVSNYDSPWSRASRSFLSAIAADPVLLAFVVVLSTANWVDVRANLVPVALAVVGALIVGAITFVGSYSERWQAKTQTPFSRAVVQFLQKLVVSLGIIQITTFDPDVLYSTGQKFLGALAAAFVSGVLTYVLNRAQRSTVIDVVPVQE